MSGSISCPHCGWVPSPMSRWICAPDGCGTVWNTFETGARCPTCDAQFSFTVCLQCERASPHRAWYHGGAQPVQRERAPDREAELG